jgi:transcriptional regulator with XRE-family HTH domain
MNLSQEFRIRREQLGVTQEYLADLSGVGLRTIKSFERGKPIQDSKPLQNYPKFWVGNWVGQSLKQIYEWLLTFSFR